MPAGPAQPSRAIRAFFALDLDPTSLRRVARVADRLRMATGAPSAAWAPASQMHVTLKFVAELPVDAVVPLGDALAALVARELGPAPCAMRLDAFPRLDNARVVVIELRDESGALGKLAQRIDELTHEHGVPREERAFRPHVTLARLKRAYAARRGARPELAAGAGDCRLVGVTLFQSKLGTGGATHTVLKTAPFGG